MLFLAADHAGYKMKEHLARELNDRHIIFEDFGTFSEESADYPGYAKRVAKAVLKSAGRGILVCGSGQGMSMAANRYRGIRAAVAWSEASTRRAREEDDANILCLPARFISQEDGWQLVSTFLSTTFAHLDRYKRRIKQLDA